MGGSCDPIGVTNHLDEALHSYRADDVENALRDTCRRAAQRPEGGPCSRYARRNARWGWEHGQEEAAQPMPPPLSPQGSGFIFDEEN